MCSAGNSRRQNGIDAGNPMEKQENIARIGNATERIHAGLQLERPSETVADQRLVAVDDKETADCALNKQGTS